MIIFRENTEDLYIGLEVMINPDIAQALKIITRKGSTRIAKSAFEYARKHGRKKVHAIHKANIMKKCDGLFLECCKAVAAEYPEITYAEHIVDNTCMQLVMNPYQYDVILTENLYGDILSDLCSGLIGGLGLVPGANLGVDAAIFEAVHGSAPDIAGQDKANPTALLQSAVLMLPSHRRMSPPLQTRCRKLLKLSTLRRHVDSRATSAERWARKAFTRRGAGRAIELQNCGKLLATRQRENRQTCIYAFSYDTTCRPLLRCLPLLLLAGCKTDSCCKKRLRSSVAEACPVNEFNASLDGGIGLRHVVSFAGPPPARVKHRHVPWIPACGMAAGDNMSEPYIVNDGKVANVFVYIKGGIPASRTRLPDAQSLSCSTRRAAATSRTSSWCSRAARWNSATPTRRCITSTRPPLAGRQPRASTSRRAPTAKPQVVKFSQPGNHAGGALQQPSVDERLHQRCAESILHGNRQQRRILTIGGLPPGNYVLAAVHEKLGEQDFQIAIPPQAARRSRTSPFTAQSKHACT